MTSIYLSLGSNMGDREVQLNKAIQLLRETNEIEVTRVSSIYETAPVGGVVQENFYNLCLSLESTLSPEAILNICQRIEQQLNRVRRIHWGPRTIDLDILLFGDEVIHTDRLNVPHPYMHDRSFILIPLNEIAPLAYHPVLKKTVSELVYNDQDVRKI